MADDEGRGRSGTPHLCARIHAGCPPSVLRMIPSAIKELSDVRDDRGKLVVFYEVAGCAYYWLPGFKRSQYIQKPRPSNLPPPPPDSDTTIVPLSSGYQGERNGMEGNGMDIIPERINVSESVPPDELKSLPLYASDVKLCQKWNELLPSWKSAYPRVDIMAEVRKAHAWELANPSLRKRNRSRFLNSWLQREQDKPLQPGEARPFHPQAPPTPPPPCGRCNSTGFIPGPPVGGATTVLPCPVCRVQKGKQA